VPEPDNEENRWRGPGQGDKEENAKRLALSKRSSMALFFDRITANLNRGDGK
jgi:hypothetical protein